MRRIAKGLIVLSGVAAVATGLTVAVAEASHGHPIIVKKGPNLTVVPQTTTTAPVRPHQRLLGENAVHLDVHLIRSDGSTDAFSVDRGVITAMSNTSLTLLRRDGKSVTITLNGSTRVVGALHIGRRSLVLSRTGVAFRVQTPQPLPGFFTGVLARRTQIVHADATVTKVDGTTTSVAFDRGKLTGFTQNSLTLSRADGKSITLGFTMGSVRIDGRLTIGAKTIVLSQGGTAFYITSHA